MTKMISKRLFSLVAASAMMWSSIPSELRLTASAADEEASVNPVFSIDHEGLKNNGQYKQLSQIAVRFNYEDALGNASTDFELDENAYYLLVHAKTDTDDTDCYQLIDLTSPDSNGQWTTPKYEYNSNTGSYDLVEGAGKLAITNDQNASANLLEAYLILNDDPSTPLTQDNAISETGCKKVDNINGIPVSWDGSWGRLDSSSWMDDTIDVTVLTEGLQVDINVYDYSGKNSYVQNGVDESYYAVFILKEKGTGKNGPILGWGMTEFDPSEPNTAAYSGGNPDRYQETIGATTFYKYEENGAKMENTIEYSPMAYDASIRIYHGESGLVNYEQVTDSSQGLATSDHPKLYRFNNPNPDSTGPKFTVDIIEDKIVYNFIVDIADDVEIPEDRYFYARVKADHLSTNDDGDSYYIIRLTSDANGIHVVQDGEGNVNEWKVKAYNQEAHRISGNETFTVTMFDGGNSTQIAFLGRKINNSTDDSPRLLYDIIYFASAYKAD